MRAVFLKQLETLHSELILMAALCEDAIRMATKSLLDNNDFFVEKTCSLECEINLKEREIDDLCVKLLLREQPVAGDFRKITAAQRMIIDLERIGDQATNIAKVSEQIKSHPIISKLHIHEMAIASIQMVSDSIDSFVEADLAKAQAVIQYDDIVDALLDKVKKELVEWILKDNSAAAVYLDLLLIAKYFERIGDHAENIAEWVIYAITGEHRHIKQQENTK